MGVMPCACLDCVTLPNVCWCWLPGMVAQCDVMRVVLLCPLPLQDIAAGQPTSHPEHYIHAIADISLVSAAGAFLNHMVMCCILQQCTYILHHMTSYSMNTLYICYASCDIIMYTVHCTYCITMMMSHIYRGSLKESRQRRLTRKRISG